MKVHSFLSTWGALFFLVLCLSVFPELGNTLTDPINLDSHRLEIPTEAKFVPKQASLSLHLITNPQKMPKYAEVLKDNQKINKSIETAIHLRDGLFALTGLNFESELAGWIGPEISFALLEANHKQQPIHWVMTLKSLNQHDAKYFLERFWQEESLGGTDINTRKYRGIGVINGEKGSINKNSKRIATALINDDLILIASDKVTLETALDSSQVADQNQFNDEDLKRTVEKLNDGVALITLSPKILNKFLDLPLEISEHEDLNRFVGTINTNETDLSLDGVLEFQKSLILVENNNEIDNLSLLQTESGPSEELGIIYSPSELLKKANQDLIMKWISQPLLKRIESAQGSAAKTIASLAIEELIWIKEPEGWIVGTKNGDPLIADVDEELKKENHFKSDISVNGKAYEVWSKFITQKTKDINTIRTEISLILSKESDYNWWGENLAALEQRHEDGLQQRQKQLKALNPNANYHPVFQLALSEKQAQRQLDDWYSWRLLQSVAGTSLKPIIKGLALTIEPNLAKDDSEINLRANLQIN